MRRLSMPAMLVIGFASVAAAQDAHADANAQSRYGCGEPGC